MPQVKAVTAARLARRCRGDAGRAPRAWRRLSAAGDRGDQVAIDAVWQLWMSAPDAALLAALSRWRQPATGEPVGAFSRIALGAGSPAEPGFPAALANAAARTGHPLGEIARARILEDRDQAVIDAVCGLALNHDALAAFCAGHRLAPADPVQRAVFFVLTGQAGQYRAADPDGSLLALGYTAAPPGQRDRLRAAMAGAGDLDLMRLVAGADRAGRDDRLTTEEAAYLADRLAERGDWPGLWQLVRQMPLVDAVTAMRSFYDSSWRPGDDAGRALFDRLAHAEPNAIRRAQDALRRRPIEPEVVVRFHGAAVAGCFSPDRRRLTVVADGWSQAAVGYRTAMHVFELPSGEPAETYTFEGTYEDPKPSSVVDLGDACVAAVWAGPYRGSSGLERCSNGGRARVEGFPGPVSALALHGDGFAALQVPWRLGQARGGDTRLLLCDRGGGVVRSFPLPNRGNAETFCLAVEPGTGRLAVGSSLVTVLDPATGATLAEAWPHALTNCLCFLGPDRLVTGHDDLQLWHLDGGRLVRGLRWKPERRGRISSIIANRWSGEIVVLERSAAYHQPMWRLDAATFAVLSGPHPGRCAVWESADGESIAFGDIGFVEVRPVHDTLRGLADRRLSELTPADRGTVERALNDPAVAPGAGPFLELVWAYLEYRFGAEVSVGGAAPVTGGSDDVALSTGGEGPC